ncbi:MAG: Na+/H+ antiporter NhaA [Inquilinus sp.]|uniref:Na+/H+ antiporter NhaA n=1 Tax=Inquilinus sp. TaxID=1932117 RepID=UPI003F37608F
MPETVKTWLVRKPISAIRSFLEIEAAGGIVLMVVAVLALIVANSPLAGAYDTLLQLPIGLRFGNLALEKTLLHWVNDGLMAVFFLLVGLEIKREILQGELSSRETLMLPGIAAAGGVVLPALIYAVINVDDPVALRGWAIPAATDIAFALGVLSLLGSRVPVSLKVFLTALAIIDDVAAVVIIALFYTGDISLPFLAWTVAGVALLCLFNWLRVQALWPYLVVGAVVWLFVLKSGLHATLAGVVLAFLVPLDRTAEDEDEPPLLRLEHSLHDFVAFLVVPIFGFANAGVSFAGASLSSFLEPVPLGIAAGLVIGKSLGVGVAAWASIRLGFAALPAGATTAQIGGVSVLAGIGFTMSLFIGSLAFEDPALQDATKMGVLAGSLIAAVLGSLWLVAVSRRRPVPVED